MRAPHSSADTAPASSARTVEAVRSLARAARLLERASGELGLAQYRVLSSVAAGEDRASRVAERFELGRPTLSAAVDTLCRAGLLERAVVATDLRASELRLTSEGARVLDAAEADMVRVLDDVFRRLPPSTTAPEALAALGAALDERARERHAAPSSRRPSPPSPPSPPCAAESAT
ncbi:MAG TPA: MarR family winged helix-turn-helix transcriptional regulator [Acidimicrobiales bacterium]|nr:MarR family winged helix-turn-helix transcriptional regulator [Acidimicrobiales bacterium]